MYGVTALGVRVPGLPPSRASLLHTDSRGLRSCTWRWCPRPQPQANTPASVPNPGIACRRVRGSRRWKVSGRMRISLGKRVGVKALWVRVPHLPPDLVQSAWDASWAPCPGATPGALSSAPAVSGASSGHGVAVTCELAMLESRVRFSVAAPDPVVELVDTPV